MTITTRRIIYLIAAAAAPLAAACDPAKSAAPRIQPAAARAPSAAEVSLPPGRDSLRSCPEVWIPELPCLRSDLP
jgi:hypothetical protein